MVGRVWHKEAGVRGSSDGSLETAEAVRAFRQARQFALAGLPDPLGLAVASLGWEGRVALDGGDFTTAVTLYLEQHAAGDPTSLQSLRITAARMLALPTEDWARFAAHAPSRRLLTAYLVSRTGGISSYDPTAAEMLERSGKWAAVLERAGIKAAREADRMAWLNPST